YDGNILSLPWIYTTYAASPEDMASQIMSRYSTYLERYYDRADVSCTAEEDPDNPNKIMLRLAISVRDKDNNIFDLSKIIKGNKTKITEITDYLNGA
ncbi:hypothetical protein ACPF8X_46205, partial [Streptomyces sp. G35A]